MGIKQLNLLIEKFCSSAKNTVKLDAYRGMKIGIDLSIFLYQIKYKVNMMQLKENTGQVFIQYLTQMILQLFKYGITPLFIFDGKPPKEKEETILERKRRKDFLTIKCDILKSCASMDDLSFEEFKEEVMKITNNEKYKNKIFNINENDIVDLFNKSVDELEKEYEKLNKRIIFITSEEIEASKSVFNLLGVKYIHQDCEAESLLSVLHKRNVIDAIISEDTDVLANGGRILLRGFHYDKLTVEEYCLEGILTGLEVNYEQFIDICILCGCDYTGKINGMGPITAHKLIKQYGNMENFMKNNRKFYIPENFNYIKARELFKNPIDIEILNAIDMNVNITKPNIVELKSFLERNNVKEKVVRLVDKELMNYYMNIEVNYNYDKSETKMAKQKKITNYFK